MYGGEGVVFPVGDGVGGPVQDPGKRQHQEPMRTPRTRLSVLEHVSILSFLSGLSRKWWLQSRSMLNLSQAGVFNQFAGALEKDVRAGEGLVSSKTTKFLQ